MDWTWLSFLISLLNGISYGLLLFMLSAGLTLVLGLMGVLNVAHASFYMLGAYVGYSATQWLGFWAALLLAPLVVGALGAVFEQQCLRRVHAHGHVPELLVTFGLSYLVLELVQLVWGRSALPFEPPALLHGPAFTLVSHPNEGLAWVWGAPDPGTCGLRVGADQVACSPFPATRAFMTAVALFMWALMALLFRRTRTGLVVQAALSHPHMVQALGHDLPRIYMAVFGFGTALAALAGVIGGSTYLTEPAMAATVGSVIFVVVVVGGLGSLGGAFLASLLLGLLQTFAVAMDQPLAQLLAAWWPGGAGPWPALADSAWARLSLAQLAPVLPYALLVVVLLLRPRGLLGRREL